LKKSLVFSIWKKYLPVRLSIAKKIGYGYSLAIGIAVLGTVVGWVSGDYYQKQAQEQLAIAQKQQYLFSELENAINAMRLHPQRLVAVLGESIWFDYETAKFLEDVNRVKALLFEFESFMNSSPHNLVIDTTELKNLLEDYETNTSSYTQLIQALWRQIEPANLKQEEIQAAEQQLLTSIRGKTVIDLSVKFDRLSENLTRLRVAAEAQQMQAQEGVEQAEALRKQIIIVSMLLYKP